MHSTHLKPQAAKPRIAILQSTHRAEIEFVTARGRKALGYAPGFLGDMAEAVDAGRGWTQGQLDAVRKIMASDAAKPAAPAPVALAAPAQMKGIIDLFAAAQGKLKRPSITIGFAGMARETTLSVAGPNAREPGTINVAEDAPFGQGAWFGRIRMDGTFAASGKVATPAELLAGLAAFAANPAQVAAEYGRATGSCCFCSRRLTDDRSLDAGYGPTCAERYGLPWGEKAAAPLLREAA